jgi:predicted acyl esterase
MQAVARGYMVVVQDVRGRYPPMASGIRSKTR